MAQLLRKPRTQSRERTKRDGAATARALAALDLFIEGKTYEEIAHIAGYASRGGAHDAVQRELGRIATEKRERAFAVDSRRWQGLWAAYYPRAKEGEIESAHLCVKLLDRRAKMFGYDLEPEPAAANVPYLKRITLMPRPAPTPTTPESEASA